MARPYGRILTPPKGSFFLYGVRGVGKSTWARETFPDAHVIDLLDEGRYQALLANPALLGLELRTLPRAGHQHCRPGARCRHRANDD